MWKEPDDKKIEDVLRPTIWTSDYPIIAYRKSIDEISLINLLDRNKENNQVVLNLAPYIFRCFVKTEVKCNSIVSNRQYEYEAHILVIVTDKRTRPILLDIRVDTLDMMAKRNNKDPMAFGYQLTCENGHSIKHDAHKKNYRCYLCGAYREAQKGWNCTEKCSWTGCKSCFACPECPGQVQFKLHKWNIKDPEYKDLKCYNTSE